MIVVNCCTFAYTPTIYLIWTCQSKVLETKEPLDHYLSLHNSLPFNSYTASSASLWSSNSWEERKQKVKKKKADRIILFFLSALSGQSYSPQNQTHSLSWFPESVHIPWKTSPHLSLWHGGSSGQWRHGNHSLLSAEMGKHKTWWTLGQKWSKNSLIFDAWGSVCRPC